MGLSSLDTALSGLKISQQQIDVISNNVSNVGTEGYTRKILPQSTQVVNGKSIGVLPETIIRNVDIRLERDLWTQVSAVNYYDVQSTYLGRVDQFNGAPSSNISVAGEVSKLQDSFAALANAPADQFLLSNVVDQAVDTASKINDLSSYYNSLRNDAQSEAALLIENINDKLVKIADLNSEIRFAQISGRTTAAAEDSRDQSIKELTEMIDISVFSRGDGVLVIQTKNGVELASGSAAKLFFNPVPLSATSSYPDSVSGIYVGDPNKNVGAIDITTQDIGGTLGGLIELRDKVFPKKMAQLDELAQKMALRFDAQGLRLFTDSSGTIPSDEPPDLSTTPATPVSYVGFSSEIQVNNAIISDSSLIQTGTYGGSLQSGANDIIRRVIEYTFGSIDYQMVANTDTSTSVDIRASATGGTTLMDWLGLDAKNQVSSGISLSNYASITDIINAGGDSVFGSGTNETDRFILRFDDPDFGSGPYDIEVDLRSVTSTGVSAAQDLVDYITADANWASIVSDFGASISVGANGELVIYSTSDIEILKSGTEPISDQGFAFLGLSALKSEAKDPYFDIKVGNNQPVRITIDPNDTETDLLAKLNAVDGLAVRMDANGFLSLRPGNDFNNPDFGGDLTIIGGPFITNSASLSGTSLGRTSIDDGVNIIQSIFGTYEILSGGVVENQSPVINIEYQSETKAGSGTYVSFRSEFLGPDASVSTDIGSSLTIKDFSQKIINEVSQELSLVNAKREDEKTLQGLLKQQLMDESGVNLDEELGKLIVVQLSYAASARVINVVEEIFNELLRAV